MQISEQKDIPHDIPQTAYIIRKKGSVPSEHSVIECVNEKPDIILHSHEACLKDKKKQAENFRFIEEESNKYEASRILQDTGNETVVVNPPYPPMSQGELDHSFDLPYTRMPHPKYKGKRIPAFDMIKFSVNLHRGCFGGCAFCTISAHQGKFIVSRSKESILREVRAITEMPDFKGYLSDLGGPSANMYAMRGKDEKICRRCKRPSCIHPKVCPNLNTDHRPLLDIYHSVDALPGIKKSFIGSGVRYDLLQYQSKDPAVNRSTAEYTRELIAHHVSGRLKVAPEHTSDQVLQIMRKPSFSQFYDFKKTFDKINKELNMRQQIIPYFISSHPGCTEEDMAELAVITKKLDFHLEQVQDFTPTPMTVATETWYTGYHPYTLQPVFSAKTPKEKLAQRMFFFWYKPEERRAIINELRKIGRADLIDKLYGKSQANAIAEQFMKEQGSGDDADNAEENKRQEDVDNSPVVKLVNNIIEGGVRQRASDIHIEPFEYNVRVRYRIDGVLREIISYDRALYAAIIARLKVISGMDISEKRKPQDGRITITVDRREYDIRVSNLPTVFGEKVVMRLASKEGFKRDKKDLGLSPTDLVKFDNILRNMRNHAQER